MGKSICYVVVIIAVVMLLSSGGLSLGAILGHFSGQPQESDPATYRIVEFEWEIEFGLGQQLISELVDTTNVEITAQAGVDENIVAIRGKGKRGYLAFNGNLVTGALGSVVSFFTDRCEYDESSETWRWSFELPRGGQEFQLNLPVGNISISQGRCRTNFYIVAQNLATGEEERIELASSMMFDTLQERDLIGPLVYNGDGRLDSYTNLSRGR